MSANNEVEKRIVEMQFDSRQFNKNANACLKSIEKIDKALDFKTDALNNLNNVDLSNVINNIQRLQSTFDSTFSIFGEAKRQLIRDFVVYAERQIIKLANSVTSLYTLAKTGGSSRALKIINAQFQMQGLLGKTKEGAEELNKVMENVNYGVADTAYGLDAAAGVAAQLIASGMKAGDEMASALRAVSGVAAMTNSSYEDMGHIFTAVAGNGRLMGEQLLSLSSRGLNAAATIAKYLGTTEQEVRKMVSQGKISFEIFYKAMDSAFGEHAKDANQTFTGSMSNIRAALSKIGADFYTTFYEKMVEPLNHFRLLINSVRKLFSERLVQDINKIQERIYRFASVILINLYDIDPDGKTSLIDPIVNAFRTGYDAISKVASDIFTIVGTIVNIFEKFNFSKGLSDILFGGIPRIYNSVKEILYGFLNILHAITAALKDSGAWDILKIIGDTLIAIFDKKSNLMQSSIVYEAVYNVTLMLSTILQKVIFLVAELYAYIQKIIGGKLTATLIGMVAKISKAFMGLINKGLDFLINNKMVVKGVNFFISALKTLGVILSGVTVSIYNFFNSLQLNAFFENSLKNISLIFDNISTSISKASQNAKKFSIDFSFIGDIINDIKNVLEKIGNRFGNFIKNFDPANAAKSVVDFIFEMVEYVSEKIGDLDLSGLFGKIFSILALQFVYSLNKINFAISDTIGMLSKALKMWFKDMFGMEVDAYSLTKQFKDIGIIIAGAIVLGGILAAIPDDLYQTGIARLMDVAAGLTAVYAVMRLIAKKTDVGIDYLDNLKKSITTFVNAGTKTVSQVGNVLGINLITDAMAFLFGTLIASAITIYMAIQGGNGDIVKEALSLAGSMLIVTAGSLAVVLLAADAVLRTIKNGTAKFTAISSFLQNIAMIIGSIGVSLYLISKAAKGLSEVNPNDLDKLNTIYKYISNILIFAGIIQLVATLEQFKLISNTTTVANIAIKLDTMQSFSGLILSIAALMIVLKETAKMFNKVSPDALDKALDIFTNVSILFGVTVAAFAMMLGLLLKAISTKGIGPVKVATVASAMMSLVTSMSILLGVLAVSTGVLILAIGKMAEMKKESLGPAIVGMLLGISFMISSLVLVLGTIIKLINFGNTKGVGPKTIDSVVDNLKKLFPAIDIFIATLAVGTALIIYALSAVTKNSSGMKASTAVTVLSTIAIYMSGILLAIKMVMSKIMVPGAKDLASQVPMLQEILNSISIFAIALGAGIVLIMGAMSNFIAVASTVPYPEYVYAAITLVAGIIVAIITTMLLLSGKASSVQEAKSILPLIGVIAAFCLAIKSVTESIATLSVTFSKYGETFGQVVACLVGLVAVIAAIGAVIIKIGGIPGIAAKAFNGFIALLAPIAEAMLVLVAFKLLISAIKDIYDLMKTIGDGGNLNIDIVDVLTNVVLGLATFAVGIVGFVGIIQLLQALAPQLTAAFNTIGTALQVLFANLQPAIIFIGEIVGIISIALIAIAAITTATQGLSGDFAKDSNKFFENLNIVAQGIGAFLVTVGQSIGTAIPTIVGSLITGLLSGLQALTTLIKEYGPEFRATVANLVMELIPFMMDCGYDLIRAVAAGLGRAGKNVLAEPMAKLLGVPESWMPDVNKTIKDNEPEFNVSDSVSKAAEAETKRTTDVLGGFQNTITSTVTKAFDGIKAEMGDAFNMDDMIDSLGLGGTDNANQLYDKLQKYKKLNEKAAEDLTEDEKKYVRGIKDMVSESGTAWSKFTKEFDQFNQGIESINDKRKRLGDSYTTDMQINDLQYLANQLSENSIYRKKIEKDIANLKASNPLAAVGEELKATTQTEKGEEQTRLDNYKKYIETEQFYDRMNTAQKLAYLRQIREEFAEGSAERLEIDRDIYSTEKQLRKETLDSYKKYIDDEQFYDRMNTAQKLAYLRMHQNEFAAGTDERKEIDKDIYSTEKQLRQESLNDYKNYITEEQEHDRMNTEKKLAFYKKIREEFAEGTDERKEIDKDIYTTEKELAKERFEEEKSNLDATMKYNEMSYEEQIAWYEKMADKYSNFANIVKECTDKVKELTLGLRDAHYEASKKWIQHSKDFDLFSGLDEVMALERMLANPEYAHKREELQKELYEFEKKYSKAFIEEKKAEAKATKKYNDDMEASEKEYNKDILKYKEDNTKKLKELEEKLAEDTKAKNEELSKSIQEVYDQRKEDIKSAAESIEDSYGLFDEVEKKASVSSTKLMKNLKNQVKSINEWDENVNRLEDSGAFTDEQIQKLREMGPSAAASIKALTKMSDKELTEYADLWSEKGRISENIGSVEIKAKNDEYIDKVKELRKKNKEEIDKINEDYNKSVEEANKELADNLEERNNTWIEKQAELEKEFHESVEEFVESFYEAIGYTLDPTVTLDALRKVAEIFGEGEAWIINLLEKSIPKADFNRMVQNGKIVEEYTEKSNDLAKAEVEEIYNTVVDSKKAEVEAVRDAEEEKTDIQESEQQKREESAKKHTNAIVGFAKELSKVKEQVNVNEIGKIAGIGSFANAFFGNLANLGKIQDSKSKDITLASNENVQPVADLDLRTAQLSAVTDYTQANINNNMQTLIETNQNGFNKVGELITQTQSLITGFKSEVVEAISVTNSRVSKLSNDILGMDVTIDGNALVGSISKRMDDSLGQIANLKRRGALA